MHRNHSGWRLAALGSLLLAACAVDTAPSGAPASTGGTAPVTAGTAAFAGAPGAGGFATAGAFATAGTLATGGALATAGTSGAAAAGSAGASTAGTAGFGGGGANAGAGGGAAGGFGTGVGGLTEGKQTKRPINEPFAKNGFLEYLPKGYGDGTKWPLLVFWAGIGEDGSGSEGDLELMYRHGPPMLIDDDEWPSERPFVVLSPQHNGQLPFDRPTPVETHDFIEFALAHYDIDPSRVYLTALSSGAKGAWDYLAMYKGSQVAAAALMAGDASEPYGNVGCSLVNAVAIWDFHGTSDSEQPYDADSSGMANFQACPQPRKEVKFTTYDGWSHQDTFKRTYDLSAGNDIYAWLLTKTR